RVRTLRRPRGLATGRRRRAGGGTAARAARPRRRWRGCGHVPDRPPRTATESEVSQAPIDVPRDPTRMLETLREDVREGLSARAKWLPSKWFYDARGSELFEHITRLPEYYPTRVERDILRARAGEVADVTEARTIVELGSGSSEKTRLLLDAFAARGRLSEFVPLDVSEAALAASAEAIVADYPGLRVHGVVADFTEPLESLPGTPPRMVIFLGGTVGNFPPGERAKFLAS